ncbi:MAG: non-lysosomal glucosylceramidase [Planctomycetes bacterium]|nr:non-lysosomal glucosylceramidase [Planctomycetota bacterium]
MPRPDPFRYRDNQLDHLCWPLGGVGASLLGLSGCGGLDRIAIRHRPDVLGNSRSFAALSFPGRPELARVLEGQVPAWKVWTDGRKGSPSGYTDGWLHGLPRLRAGTFTHRFPLAELELGAPGWPLAVRLQAWSPFIPGDADASHLPAAVLSWRFANPGRKAVRAVFSYHVQRELLRDRNAKADGERIRRTAHGIAFDYAASEAAPWNAAGLSAEIDGALADCAWFRGGWFDNNTILWRSITEGRAEERAPHEGTPGGGASLWLPITVPAGGETTVTLRLAWHEPLSDMQAGPKPEAAAGGCGCAPGACCPPATYRPRYAEQFASVDAVADALRTRCGELERRTRAFADALHASDMPAEALAAATANLPILRSPTVLRQHDGRLWGWEGCHVDSGCCDGSCTHVWNYAQAVAHLFPELERSLRETEFGESQDDRGHQNFRSALPIRPTHHTFHAAADGQFGGIIKVWREWQIGGDLAWLRRLWPQVRASLGYCIATWDPDRIGALVEPHHNTYDIEFWGPDGMCGSVYAAALKAAAAMAEALGEDPAPWRELLAKTVEHLDRSLFRQGRYIQEVMRATPRAGDPGKQKHGSNAAPYAEASALLDAEGPKYQYGTGCLADGVIGAWLAEAAGLGSPLDPRHVRSHLAQVHRHNLKHDLSTHANPQRPNYALGDEGGLLLCTWPDGGRPTLPFVYSEEVWTGIEYQVASHCIMTGLVEQGLDIVRTARARYDDGRRNPFDEYECGHWYARALSSWALLPALTGVRYSAVERTLWISPTAARRPYRAFLGVGGAFGSVKLEKPALTVTLAEGALAIDRVVVDGRMVACSQRAEAGCPLRIALGGAKGKGKTKR